MNLPAQGEHLSSVTTSSSFQRVLASKSQIPSNRRAIYPQGPQAAEYLNTDADIAIFGGVKGCGKTVMLLADPLRCIHLPRFTSIIFRRHRVDITKVGGLWAKSRRLYTHRAESNSSNLTWTFPGGSVVQLGHLDDEDSVNDWDGTELAMIAYDQLETFSESQFWYMFSCLRSDCGVAPFVRATCNPVPDNEAFVGAWLNRLIRWWLDKNGQYPDWSKSGRIRWFVRDESTGAIDWADSRDELITRHGSNELPMSITFIPGRLEENEALMTADPTYRTRLKTALLPVDRKRLMLGDWLAVETAGDFFQSSWFSIVEAAPPMVSAIRYWDRAASENNPTGSWTAGVLMGKDERGAYYVVDVVRLQGRPGDVQAAIDNTASKDGHRVKVGIEQDPGQAGVAEAESHVKRLAELGYSAKTNTVRESKATRVRPYSSLAQVGGVKIVRGAWNHSYLRELENYDGSKKCMADQVDASSGAFHLLTSHQRSTAIFGASRGVSVG